ncbi:Glycosyltransferase involved in cell wall bisynthesis [Roseovarius azorensis]|uniref:Glycosyltransferase involved in cell wall bisynthesis n=1 Tax=Roseovarius azorensis TaxID=1287727 RepID=A0A1H7PXX3_9RHOB|nr:glycosyltransferase [Roseovarius azorensis]SEL40328.1 Glycosyltransferase involved in cell wall bisynthesis [Roseovarius azorensis]
MLRTLLRPALIWRFCASAREEGLTQALRKARIHAGRVWRGDGRSAVAPATDVPSGVAAFYLSGTWQSLARAGGFAVSQPPAVLSRRRRIALIGDLNLPQCRKYRVEQLAAFWLARDVEVVHSHYLDVPRSVHALQEATHLIEYRLRAMPVNAMYRYEARRLKLPVLYDLDDPLFSVPAYETYHNMTALDPSLKQHFLTEAPSYLETMNGADILSVSTPGMAAHTRDFTPRPVFVRRNFADAQTLDQGRLALAEAAARDDSLFRVAFASGSQGHEADFAVIADQIAAFLDGAGNRRLVILGHFDTRRLPTVLRDRVEVHGFSTYDSYLHSLARADCAVMPLADDLFNRCKSAVRVIDAAAVGLPSIVGRVSDMAHVVRGGRTGIVVPDDSGWLSALETLADDPAGTRAMGAAARRDLETRWSGQEAAHIIAPELLEWVRG